MATKKPDDTSFAQSISIEDIGFLELNDELGQMEAFCSKKKMSKGCVPKNPKKSAGGKGWFKEGTEGVAKVVKIVKIFT